MIVCLGVATSVQAGVLSVLSSIVNKNQTLGSVSLLNSQTIPLLENNNMSIGTDKKDLVEAEIVIVNNSALVAEAGPLCTAVDIQDLPSKADHISVYVVHAGDSLPAIANMFGVSVNTIIWANDLKKNQVIKEGQVLIILPISGVKHLVVKGDTIASIAKKYKGDAKEIAQFNNLEVETKLTVGMEIIVPNGEVVPPAVVIKQPVKGEVRIPSPNKLVYSGYYLRPTRGGLKTQGIHGQNAVDLANKLGSEIYAAASGTVIVAKTGGWNGGYGNYIVIKHKNNTQTLYAHLLKVNVGVGQTVSQGEVIGQMGSSGRSTGTHLHFEIRGATNPF